MKIPERLHPNPIVDFVIDIRFAPKPPIDAVFGLVYSVIKPKFGNMKKLPILQVPDEIRNNDPNLLFQPYYRLTDKQFIVQVGPRIIAISAPQYPGWDIVLREAMDIFKATYNIPLFDKLNRIGIRYVNFFNENIFDNSKLSLRMQSRNLAQEKTFLRTEIENNGCKSLIQVSNRSKINDKIGSIIDIDTYFDEIKPYKDIIFQIEKILSAGHDTCKHIFFELIKEDYLKKFNPTYEG